MKKERDIEREREREREVQREADRSRYIEINIDYWDRSRYLVLSRFVMDIIIISLWIKVLVSTAFLLLHIAS